MRRDSVLLNLVILLALAFAGYGLTHYFDSSPAPQEQTQTTPDFSFTDIHGKTHKLSSFRNKVIIVNFWATWCPPCVEEFPRLIETAKNHPGDVVLIALSGDTGEAPIKNFLKTQKLETGSKNIFIALDEKDIAGTKFKTFQYPETYIVGRDGNLAGKLVGARWTKADLDKKIRALK